MAKTYLKCTVLVDVKRVVDLTEEEKAKLENYLKTECDCIYNSVTPELAEILFRKTMLQEVPMKETVDFENIELFDINITINQKTTL